MKVKKRLFPGIQKGKEFNTSRPALKKNRREIIPNGNLDLYKEMKSTKNGNYVGKCKLFCYLNL